MSSVTTRIKNTKQPYGGYVPMNLFTHLKLTDEHLLNAKENVHPSIIGVVIDYLFRYYTSNDVTDSFKNAILGAWNVGEINQAIDLIADIGELNERTIVASCKLAGYDVAYRAGPEFFNGIHSIEPDKDTIENIRIMMERCLAFAAKFGPITADGFTFDGAYTNEITVGEGDFLTETVLWDLKTSRNKPTSKDSLQLLIYYLMGQKSTVDVFDGINELALFNPRRHEIYYIDVKDLSEDVKYKVMHDVIGYQ